MRRARWRRGWAGLALALTAACTWLACSGAELGQDAGAGGSGASAGSSASGGSSGSAGSGARAGSSGSGGSAAAAGSGGSYAFADDPNIWDKMPDERGATQLYSTRIPEGYLGLGETTSCGPGCRKTSSAFAKPSGFYISMWQQLAANAKGSTFTLRRSVAWREEDDWWSAVTVTEFDPERVLGAWQTTRPSGTSYSWNYNAPRWLFLTNDDAPGNPIYIRASRITGPSSAPRIEWSPWHPGNGLCSSTFAWEDGWGIELSGTLYVSPAMQSPRFEKYPQPLYVTNTVCEDALCVWTNLSGGPPGQFVLWALSPQERRQEQIFVPPPEFHALAPGIDEDYIYVAVMGGPRAATDYFYESCELYQISRTINPAEVTAKKVADIDANFNVIHLHSRGSYVSFRACGKLEPTDDVNRCWLHVVNISTKQQWKILPQQGEAWYQALAVSTEEVLAATKVAGLQPSADTIVGPFYRFRFDSLDAIEEASRSW